MSNNYSIFFFRLIEVLLFFLSDILKILEIDFNKFGKITECGNFTFYFTFKNRNIEFLQFSWKLIWVYKGFKRRIGSERSFGKHDMFFRTSPLNETDCENLKFPLKYSFRSSVVKRFLIFPWKFPSYLLFSIIECDLK